MFKHSIDIKISPMSDNSPFSLASESCKDSNHLEGYLSDESAMSNCSTNNSLNSSPMAERHIVENEIQINFCIESS